jgi:hypothetical protein
VSTAHCSFISCATTPCTLTSCRSKPHSTSYDAVPTGQSRMPVEAGDQPLPPPSLLHPPSHLCPAATRCLRIRTGRSTTAISVTSLQAPHPWCTLPSSSAAIKDPLPHPQRHPSYPSCSFPLSSLPTPVTPLSPPHRSPTCSIHVDSPSGSYLTSL